MWHEYYSGLLTLVEAFVFCALPALIAAFWGEGAFVVLAAALSAGSLLMCFLHMGAIFDLPSLLGMFRATLPFVVLAWACTVVSVIVKRKQAANRNPN
jgi:prepilin signal peptidase PulO-like enzyme (type II secretory pathway)